MIVACCDSRADPATIFDAAPGSLFVLRNVANLVPPYAPDGEYHGTSAALEFAVTVIEVENIVVMGHGQCGGIAASLDERRDPASPGDFIGKWISLLEGARTDVSHCGASAPASRQQAVEFAAVRHSLANLMTFPFVRMRVAAGRLRLRGAWFEIASGRLLAMDPQTKDFAPVSQASWRSSGVEAELGAPSAGFAVGIIYNVRTPAGPFRTQAIEKDRVNNCGTAFACPTAE